MKQISDHEIKKQEQALMPNSKNKGPYSIVFEALNNSTIPAPPDDLESAICSYIAVKGKRKLFIKQIEHWVISVLMLMTTLISFNWLWPVWIEHSTKFSQTPWMMVLSAIAAMVMVQYLPIGGNKIDLEHMMKN